VKYHEPQNFTGGVLAQAETRLQLLDYKRTAAAYEQAMAAAPSIDLLQNLAAAYVNDGKPQSAIDAVKAAGQHLPSSQEELATMGYSETEISLLLGRVYAQWPGHDGQALDIYDKLIQKNPDDFR
jgi:tetratricopeptide (TPR) repeat protein